MVGNATEICAAGLLINNGANSYERIKQMSKIILLDVDGVLNCYTTQEKCPGGFRGIEDDLVKNLKSIVNATGASIVLTSDWKDDWECQYLNYTQDGKYLIDALRKHNLAIIDKTNDHSIGRSAASGRGAGIKGYLMDHLDVENYVVLDDVIFNDFDDDIMEHLIHTEEWEGLTEDKAKEAIAILAGAPEY